MVDVLPSKSDSPLEIKRLVGVLRSWVPNGDGYNSQYAPRDMEAAAHLIEQLAVQRKHHRARHKSYKRRYRELLALAEASEWQPIETAPKDGTRILALLRWGYSDGTAGEAQTVIYWYGGGLFWVVPIPMNYVQGLDSDVAPTHWMPLPKPPERVREVERE